MNLKPELLDLLTQLGLVPDEVETLRSRMMSAVTALEAQVTALNSQIDQLLAQRDAAQTELAQAYITVGKLVTAN